MQQPAQPSMKVAMEKAKQQAVQDGAQGNEIGLLPDTFIMPSGKNRPSWFSNYKGRMMLERKRLRERFWEVVAALAYRWYTVRPRPRLRLFTIPGIAKELHKEMYANFAPGDLQPVESKICDGLLGSLRQRIGQRANGQNYTWRLHKYLSSPRLVSYKAALIPNPSAPPGKTGNARTHQNGIVQAVVRIHSLQSLHQVKRSQSREDGRWVQKDVVLTPQGQEIPIEEPYDFSKNAKEMVEYFVVQKMLRRSEEGPWMIWGFAEETTMDKLIRQQKKKKKKKSEGVPSVA